MERSPGQYVSCLLVLIMLGSIISIAWPFVQPSYASIAQITVNIGGDEVTHKYGASDTVSFVGKVAEVITGKTVSIKIKDPTGSIEKSTSTTPNESSGDFDYPYDIPSSPLEGVWTLDVTYNTYHAYTYFIVDDQADTISVDLNRADSIYAAGDQVTITGQVGTTDISEDNVVITVFDPTNDRIVDDVYSLLGAGTLPNDEFKYSFTLDSQAKSGRYAVVVTYNVDNQEGSNLFEIPASANSGTDFTGDSDSDGNLQAQIEKDTYNAGDNVAIEGSIAGYNSADNEDLAAVVKDPSGVKVNEYSDSSANVPSNGDFSYNFDLASDADPGTYSVTMTYASDQVQMTFDVQGSGGSTSSADLVVKLNKSSYLAGETIVVSGTVKHVADPKDEEQVSILLYKPNGEVILSSSKYVTPPSSGAFSANILIPSSATVQKGYKIVVSYLDDEVKTSFDITGVSSTPSDKISVKTDKDKYNIGDTVKISGSIPSMILVQDQQLLIRVNTPDGNPCRLDPIDPTSSGGFSYDLVLGGKCGMNGEYVVEATYSGEKSKTSFVLAGSSRSEYGLKVADKTYSIGYEMSAGSIKGMFTRYNDNKLVVNLDAQEDGKLTLVLPRQVIDAIKDGKDIAFIVTIEDESGNTTTVQAVENQTTDDERTLEINYKGGAERVEIAGTQIVPEFGPVVAIVMAVAIIGIIMATTRFNNFIRRL